MPQSSGAYHTYPQTVGQRDHLGRDGFRILLPDGIQDNVSQESVTFLCIKHLFPGQRETKKSHLCGGRKEERVDMAHISPQPDNLRDSQGDRAPKEHSPSSTLGGTLASPQRSTGLDITPESHLGAGDWL